MASSLMPTCTESFSAGDQTREHWFALAVETVKRLGWTVENINATSLIAVTEDEEIQITLNGETVIVKSTCMCSPPSDPDKNRNNTHVFRSTFEQLKNTSSKEDLSRMSRELLTELVRRELEAASVQRPTTTREDIEYFFSLFIPKKDYVITPILLDLNLLIFLLMALGGADLSEPEGELLLQWGASYKPLVLSGEWWRLLTACFVHIGFMHLFMNMFALIYIGKKLDPLLGELRFGAAYLLTGLAASMASLWWHDGIPVLAAGASGAIFGMYGVFIALLTTNLIEKEERKDLLPMIVGMIAYNLIFGLKGGVDNAAHIGGLLSGVFAGYLFSPSLRIKENKRLYYGSVVFLSLIIVSAAHIVYRSLSAD